MKLKRVYLEISNICNLSCDFCSDHHRPLKSMSLQEIDMILSQIKEVTDYVYLHLKGEPLLHPNFREVLTLCENHQLYVQLVTNGTFLNLYPDLISRKCIRKVSFSLHSIPYQKLSAEEYISPILDFAKKASQQGAPYVELRFWNKDTLDDKSKICLETIKAMHPLKETNRPGSYKWINQVYVHFDSQFEWPSEADAKDNYGTCQGARSMIGILCDGTVVPCCLDDRGTINLGNIFNESLTSILHSKRLSAMQKGFNERKLIEPLCQKCTYRHRFD